MTKTSEAQKRASKNYTANMKAKGFERTPFWIKPAWKEAILQLIKELENYKG